MIFFYSKVLNYFENSNGILKELTVALQSNLARSISASYVIEVHAGRQLHPYRNDFAIGSFKPSITSSPSNFFSAS